MILNLFLITIIIVFGIDYARFVDDAIKPLIKKILKIPANRNISLKPFDCSLCASFWAGLIYICILNQFTFVNLFFVTLFSFLSKPISMLLNFISEFLCWLIDKLYSILSK